MLRQFIFNNNIKYSTCGRCSGSINTAKQRRKGIACGMDETLGVYYTGMQDKQERK